MCPPVPADPWCDELQSSGQAVLVSLSSGAPARPGGAWEVRFETTAGAETDVVVGSDGTATVRRTDTETDDDVPTSTLSDSAITSITQAALAEARSLGATGCRTGAQLSRSRPCCWTRPRS